MGSSWNITLDHPLSLLLSVPPPLHRGARGVGPSRGTHFGLPQGVPLSVPGLGGVSCLGPRPGDGPRVRTTNHLNVAPLQEAT